MSIRENDTSDVHTGKPIVRTSPDGKRVTVLCPYGHLVTAIPMKEWAGSALEARVGHPDCVVECRGAL